MQHQLKIVNVDVVDPVNRKRGFLEWMSYIQNVYQGNHTAMDRAMERLTIYNHETRNRG